VIGLKLIALSLLVFSFFMPLAHAQEKVCTQMGCTNGLVLRPDDNQLNQPGRYEISFFFDVRNQNQVVCTGQLPLKPCDQGNSFVCSTNDVRIGESGCALPADQHKIDDIYIFGTPRKVVIIAKHNGAPVLARTIRPKYVFTRPNGPGCDPQCVTSSASLGRKD
jgi:hypothetical protein